MRPPEVVRLPPRRTLLALALAAALPARADRSADLRWIAEAERQKQRALG
jgi:hypothetical protein